MTTATREERRAKLRAENKAWKVSVTSTARPGTENEIKDAIRKTNLQYLWNSNPQEYTTTETVRATVHCGCLQQDIELPAGTQGWLYASCEKGYDAYVWIGDEQYPAAGANVISRTTYYTFACLVKVDGSWVVSEAFKTTEWKAK